MRNVSCFSMKAFRLNRLRYGSEQQGLLSKDFLNGLKMQMVNHKETYSIQRLSNFVLNTAGCS